MNVSRRSLITGIGCIMAAPAIVRASSLMKVKAVKTPSGELYYFDMIGNLWRHDLVVDAWSRLDLGNPHPVGWGGPRGAIWAENAPPHISALAIKEGRLLRSKRDGYETIYVRALGQTLTAL